MHPPPGLYKYGIVNQVGGIGKTNQYKQRAVTGKSVSDRATKMTFTLIWDQQDKYLTVLQPLLS